MRKKVLVVLADGFEEIEAISVIDVLRRAQLEVTVASVGKREVQGAHGVSIISDVEIEKVNQIPDLVVLPGGMPGSENLAKSQKLKQLITEMNASKKAIGAICAAPAVVLQPAGLLKGRKATCYPGFESRFDAEVTFAEKRVVRDGNITTSRGPGTAIEFALELVRQLAGDATADKLTRAMLVKT